MRDNEQRQYPPISDVFIETLRERFAHLWAKIPRMGTSPEQLWFDFGKRWMIQHLEDEHRKQKKL